MTYCKSICCCAKVALIRISSICSKGMVYETRWIKECVKRRTKCLDVLLCDVVDQSVRLVQ